MISTVEVWSAEGRGSLCAPDGASGWRVSLMVALSVTLKGR